VSARAILLASGTLLVVGACGAPSHQQQGIVTVNTATSFCVGLPAASGFCTSPDWAEQHHVRGLAAGDCVRVTYSSDEATDASVTRIDRVPGCHQKPPTPTSAIA
jgi:hypothetical protein